MSNFLPVKSSLFYFIIGFLPFIFVIIRGMYLDVMYGEVLSIPIMYVVLFNIWLIPFITLGTSIALTNYKNKLQSEE